MKWLLPIAFFGLLSSAHAQTWAQLPKGVRCFGFRNVTTTPIKSNFNQFRSETSLSTNFRVDAVTLNQMAGNILVPGQDMDANAYKQLLVGEYGVDAKAQANVNGMGFAYGLTDKVMLYAEIAYYNANVQARLKRTKDNNFKQVAEYLANKTNMTYSDKAIQELLNRMVDLNEHNIQSVVVNHFGYKPIGNWQGTGYGDMETGVMIKAIDKGTWGLQLYPGVVLPTGRQDDPNMLQDIGFGDGQTDIFGEIGTGYIVNDNLAFGTRLRYTYQSPSNKRLRVPTDRDFPLSAQTGTFNVKYGDKLNFMLNSTIAFNDWFSITPVYRYLYQAKSQYDSNYGVANDYLSYNTNKQEHQVQLTTSISSIQPFLKKKFVLPAQINFNVVQTVAGQNVPKVGRFEIELRLIF
ncbi:MAG: hypothetical protein ACJ76H_05495 [Bacteriovoracaceae bacterium]